MFWLMLFHIATADNEDGLLKRGPMLWYLPTAPYPGQINKGVPSRRALDPAPRNDGLLSENQEATGHQDLFGPDPLGPEDQTTITLPPQTQQHRGPFGSQAFGLDPSPKEQNFDLESILDGPPAFREAVAHLNRSPIPFSPLLRFGPKRLIRPGEQDYAYQPGLKQPWQPMIQYGLPRSTASDMGPIAVGPYLERRVRPIRVSPTTVRTRLAPLRDIEHTTLAFDSWLDAYIRGRNYSTRPTQESNPLAPPAPPPSRFLPLRGRHSKTLPSKYPRTGLPLSSGEGFVPSLRLTRPTYVPSRLFPDFTETTTRPPPRLLGAEDGLLEELSPESGDHGSLFSQERKLLPNLRKEPLHTFNNILTL